MHVILAFFFAVGGVVGATAVALWGRRRVAEDGPRWWLATVCGMLVPLAFDAWGSWSLLAEHGRPLLAAAAASLCTLAPAPRLRRVVGAGCWVAAGFLAGETAGGALLLPWDVLFLAAGVTFLALGELCTAASMALAWALRGGMAAVATGGAVWGVGAGLAGVLRQACVVAAARAPTEDLAMALLALAPVLPLFAVRTWGVCALTAAGVYANKDLVY